VTLNWRVLESSPSSTELKLETARGACDKLQAPKVVQSTEEVAITLTVLRDSGACTDQAILWRPVVGLRAPLGRRMVVPGR
jgi:hypothetical protein